MKDPRNTWINGILLGVVTPFVFFYLAKGLGMLLAEFVFERFDGFSLRLNCIIALVSNVIPFQIMLRQHRDRALQGIVLATLVLLFALIFYFRSYFFQ